MSDGERGHTGTAEPATDPPSVDNPTVATETEGLDGLVVVCGLPGVGKTTVARRIAERSAASVLRTDAVRKELFAEPEYTDAETEAVYSELLSRAADALDEGETVVLDATFAESSFREDARAVAANRSRPFHLIKVQCGVDVVEERIRERDGLSDADFEVHMMFREEFDPFELDHVAIDNSGTETATLAQIDDLL